MTNLEFRRLRIESGFSRPEIAKALELKEETIGFFEQGRRRITERVEAFMHGLNNRDKDVMKILFDAREEVLREKYDIKDISHEKYSEYKMELK